MTQLAEFNEKIRELTEKIASEPENASLYMERAEFYRQQFEAYCQQSGNVMVFDDRESDAFDNALKDYNKAIQLNPKSADAYVSRGNLYARIGYVKYKYTSRIGKFRCYFRDEALEDYNKAIELDPECAEAYFKRGDCYFEIEEYYEALKDYDKYIKLNPNSSDAYAGRGDCYYFMGNYKEALNDYNKAIEFNPECGYCYNSRGHCYFDMKKYIEASEDFHKANLLDAYNDREIDPDPMMKADFSAKMEADHLAERERSEIEHQKAIAQARVDERNKVIQDLSHSIKNLISTVIDPLENLKQEKLVNPQVIENALRGANLVREIVNAMNLSFKGTIDDFYYDAKHNEGKDRLNLQSVLVQSLKYSVGNMFDGKYFNSFMRKYFPEKNIYLEAKSEWTNISQSEYSGIQSFLQKYFFETDIVFSDADKFVMGNEKGSGIKLMILFQEIILNAVKYAAFADREKRFLRIHFLSDEKDISVKVENAFEPTVKTKTSGIGHVIIDNFAKLLKAKPVVTKENHVYSVAIRFPNFWKEQSE
ncbi:MAG: hypothetical protein BWK80_43800 [Desulfobacteraceae bacterium IS3]|nr:MAG: hypothetical protein BWK80_43800 [Desulfobacteraceae bacterium IS3]